MKLYPSFFKQTLKLSLIAILSVSCSLNIPRSSIAALDPLSAEPHPWPVITDDNENYSLTLEPLENVGDMLAFGVRVYNNQPDSLYIDPRSWVMHTTSFKNGMEMVDTLSVLSAEEIATSYRELGNQIKEAENNKQAAVIIISIVLVVGLIIVLANIDDTAQSSDDDEEEEDDYQIVDRVSSSISFSYYGGPSPRIRNELTPKEQINLLNDIATRYDHSEILPTYIRPFEEVSFEVYFRRLEGLRRFNLQWQLADQQLSWEFLHDIDKNHR